MSQRQATSESLLSNAKKTDQIRKSMKYVTLAGVVVIALSKIRNVMKRQSSKTAIDAAQIATLYKGLFEACQVLITISIRKNLKVPFKVSNKLHAACLVIATVSYVFWDRIWHVIQKLKLHHIIKAPTKMAMANAVIFVIALCILRIIKPEDFEQKMTMSLCIQGISDATLLPFDAIHYLYNQVRPHIEKLRNKIFGTNEQVSARQGETQMTGRIGDGGVMSGS